MSCPTGWPVEGVSEDYLKELSTGSLTPPPPPPRRGVNSQESSVRSSSHIVAIAMETKLLGFIPLIFYHHCGDLRKIPGSSRKVPKRDIYISAIDAAARAGG